MLERIKWNIKNTQNKENNKFENRSGDVTEYQGMGDRQTKARWILLTHLSCLPRYSGRIILLLILMYYIKINSGIQKTAIMNAFKFHYS